MRLVLDTNVFANKKFCDWLRKHDEVEKILPCIGYLELIYHYLKRGKTEDFVDKFLEVHGVGVAPFNMEVARVAARAATKRWDFKEKAGDYIIGATVIVHDAKLVTYNLKDFGWLPRERVLSPDEFLKFK